MQHINITNNQYIVHYINSLTPNTKAGFYIFFITLLITYMSGLSSCTKPSEPDLVPITTSGKNTMGFYVDGKPVKIQGKYDPGGIFTPPYGVTGSLTSYETVYLFAVSKNPTYYFTLYVPIDSINTLGEYRLHRSRVMEDETSISETGLLGGNHYNTSEEHDGIIKFIRRDQSVLSGTFEFDAINKETGKVISITDGRFDIKWR